MQALTGNLRFRSAHILQGWRFKKALVLQVQLLEKQVLHAGAYGHDHVQGVSVWVDARVQDMMHLGCIESGLKSSTQLGEAPPGKLTGEVSFGCSYKGLVYLLAEEKEKGFRPATLEDLILLQSVACQLADEDGVDGDRLTSEEILSKLNKRG